VNFIQTLYVNNSQNPFYNGFGWVKPQYHLMSWALSCLQLNKLYGQIELFANTDAAKLLIDILDLPYEKINVTHDKLHLADEKLWALPKLYTYSLQNEPFLHLDGDVFIFEHFSESLLKSELIAQNVENATEYYISTQKELLLNFNYFPKCVKEDFDSPIPIKAINAGILGGNNIIFFKEYADSAFEYINRNLPRLSSINVDKFNVFFEQHLFYSLAKERGIPIGLYYNDIISDNEYKFLANFHEVRCHRNYLHLLGHFKRDEFTCLQMAAKLRELYPEYYYKITRICMERNISIFHNFYYNETLANFSDFKALLEKAKSRYQKGKVSNDLEINEFCNKIPDLSLLTQTYNYYAENQNNLFDQNNFRMDFETFTKNLSEVLQANSHLSDYYLYGRDIESINWYCEIFGNNTELPNKIISRCKGLSIIESEFDWGGLINKNKREGITYYLNLQLLKGQFYNLVIPEISKEKYSLFDIDDLEKLILDHLCQPLSVKNLLLEMQVYVDEDVIQNNLETYNNLIIELIKQLVVKKAICPIYEL
jgi:hypothetical protein